ncbi:MAG TPA: HAD family hydrolase [Gaiellaceae bacterium]|nr:HAD family hydrolase [Gaiellaceae bacterium]
MSRAVVFDLWNTLAVWPEEDSRVFRHRWSALLGVTPEDLDEVWYAPGVYTRRETGPIADALTSVHASFGVIAEVSDVVEWRLDIARRALVPDAEVVATLKELRRRGIATGLISNCTEEVALVWDETPFAALFDAAIFSATARCMKPEREIYELALAELGISASDALFVGDGANDELPGAQRVGMTPILLLPDGNEPRWDGVRDWSGLRVASIPDVLSLIV